MWLFDPTARRGRTNKHVLPWVSPYVVKKRFDINGEIGVTYRIKLKNGRRQLAVHHNRIKRCGTSCHRGADQEQKSQMSKETKNASDSPEEMQVMVEIENKGITNEEREPHDVCKADKWCKLEMDE